MTQTVLMGIGGLWLAMIAFFVDTSNARSAFVFQIVPFILAIFFCGFALARFMGWPVGA